MTRRGVAVLAVVVVVAALSGWVGSQATAGSPASASSTVPTATAAIVRTDLSTTTQVTGTLGYAGSYQVISQQSGTTLTALAAPGTVVQRGQPLFEVDGTAVPLMYGTRPMWRAIAAGITAGPDVYELDQNLIALGFTDAGYLTPGNDFTAATAAAINAWQLASGLPQTASVQPGEVAFLPGPIRVSALSATVGAPVQPGAVLMTATSASRSIEVQLPVTQEYLIKVGDRVTITLPDGVTTTPGTIAQIAPVATAPASGSGSGGQGSAGGGQGNAAGGNGGSGGPATVDVSVSLTNPAAAGQYDQAPVEVNIVDSTASNVLAVPISALVALAGGGYGVAVVSHSRQTLISVRTGLFADTLVQVSGAGLRPGMLVEVPKP